MQINIFLVFTFFRWCIVTSCASDSKSSNIGMLLAVATFSATALLK